MTKVKWLVVAGLVPLAVALAVAYLASPGPAAVARTYAVRLMTLGLLLAGCWAGRRLLAAARPWRQ